MGLHTGADFFAETTITVEVAAYYEDGVYELPAIFHVIDDNITERAESFAIISGPGPDISPCGYPFRFCYWQFVATQIIIIDNDCKLIKKSVYTSLEIGHD